MERDLIPELRRILDQRGFRVNLRLIKDILRDLHKNERRKWKNNQLDERVKNKKKSIGHIINRMSEINILLSLLIDIKHFKCKNLPNFRSENEERKGFYQ